MGDAQVDQNQLEQIGNYVKSHIGQWLKEQNILTFPERERAGLDKELLERMITVEQQLKFQNEKLEMMMEQSDKRFESMERRFDAVDKRFESEDKRFESVDKRFEDMQHYMDKRFEDVNKRFNMLTWLIGISFVMLTTLMSLYNFVV